MNAELILLLLVPATYVAMLAIEAAYPARQFPRVPWWRAIGLFGLIVMLAVGIVTPLLLPVEWLDRHRLLDGTKLGVPLGVVVGYLVLSFMSFVWHRSLHRFSLLWRLHQLHHAPRRLDLSSGTVFHPADIFLFSAVQVVALTLVIGLDPLAAAITGYVATFYSLFQHWNVKTPRWLGYVIQRPEAHCEHHELGVHARNYSDFPLWDMIFRTSSNPSAFDGRVGFAVAAPVGKMLRFVDVHRGEGSGTSARPLDAAAE
ncbi:MAG TPA: sterol desaturase family protein [Labilithrix sp.]|nr:sterol desaturase family protein [Labilithrix sp.]